MRGSVLTLDLDLRSLLLVRVNALPQPLSCDFLPHGMPQHLLLSSIEGQIFSTQYFQLGNQVPSESALRSLPWVSVVGAELEILLCRV